MERKLVLGAFAGFTILSLWGVLLRLMQVTPIEGLNYSFILHAHSHFAFSGWIFLAMALLIIKAVSPANLEAYKAFFVLTLICSFGMLFSFSLQGYKAASITFSTLFIFAGYYFTYKILSCREFYTSLEPHVKLLIRSSLIYQCLSSLGPFALALIMATGNKGTPLYHNAIYFYLHFQMNGWMLVGALGLFMNLFKSAPALLRFWLRVFIYSVIPLFSLFTLWNSPPVLVQVFAFVAASIHLLSWIKILPFLVTGSRSKFLLKAAIVALTIKAIVQVWICFPAIGTWVFSNRNLIIGYIHLLVLGGIMPLILEQFISSKLIAESNSFRIINAAFAGMVIIYLVTLFFPPLLVLKGVFVPQLQLVLLVISIGFLIVGVGYLVLVIRGDKTKKRHLPMSPS